jgi:hypothetical protein
MIIPLETSQENNPNYRILVVLQHGLDAFYGPPMHQ